MNTRTWRDLGVHWHCYADRTPSDQALPPAHVRMQEPGTIATTPEAVALWISDHGGYGEHRITELRAGRTVHNVVPQDQGDPVWLIAYAARPADACTCPPKWLEGRAAEMPLIIDDPV